MTIDNLRFREHRGKCVKKIYYALKLFLLQQYLNLVSKILCESLCTVTVFLWCACVVSRLCHRIDANTEVLRTIYIWHKKIRNDNFFVFIIILYIIKKPSYLFTKIIFNDDIHSVNTHLKILCQQPSTEQPSIREILNAI